jgi:hypothetical protein
MKALGLSVRNLFGRKLTEMNEDSHRERVGSDRAFRALIWTDVLWPAEERRPLVLLLEQAERVAETCATISVDPGEAEGLRLQTMRILAELHSETIAGTHAVDAFSAVTMPGRRDSPEVRLHAAEALARATQESVVSAVIQVIYTTDSPEIVEKGKSILKKWSPALAESLKTIPANSQRDAHPTNSRRSADEEAHDTDQPGLATIERPSTAPTPRPRASPPASPRPSL